MTRGCNNIARTGTIPTQEPESRSGAAASSESISTPPGWLRSIYLWTHA